MAADLFGHMYTNDPALVTWISKKRPIANREDYPVVDGARPALRAEVAGGQMTYYVFFRRSMSGDHGLTKTDFAKALWDNPDTLREARPGLRPSPRWRSPW